MLHGYGPGPQRPGAEQRTRLLDAGAVRDWFALAVASAEETREKIDILSTKNGIPLWIYHHITFSVYHIAFFHLGCFFTP